MTRGMAIADATEIAERTKSTAYVHRPAGRGDVSQCYNYRFNAPIESVAEGYVTVAIIWPDGRVFQGRP